MVRMDSTSPWFIPACGEAAVSASMWACPMPVHPCAGEVGLSPVFWTTLVSDHPRARGGSSLLSDGLEHSTGSSLCAGR